MAVALGGGGGRDDRNLRLGLIETMRQAWADDELRPRLRFMLYIFMAYAVGVHIPVPIPGIDPTAISGAPGIIDLLNSMGGGAFKRVSILALGLGPYISASIIMQVLTLTNPKWKKEQQEGGQYARAKQARITRFLALGLCVFQSIGLLQMMGPAVLMGTGSYDPSAYWMKVALVTLFWSTGAMLMLWLGDLVTEKGIGNGVSLIIFAGIVISFPSIIGQVSSALADGTIGWWQVAIILALFIGITFLIVFFTVAQRRIPIQHLRRNFGTKSLGGGTSYLPISVNMAGVIPIIFAISLIYMPSQFATFFPVESPVHQTLLQIGQFFQPNFSRPQGYVGALVYLVLIFAFTYVWNAMMYSVKDIADNLKRGGSYIPGIRPGKQTVTFLNDVISRVTFVGAIFLAVVALSTYIFPLIAPIQSLPLIGGTSILIMVSVALETLRQIEANLLTKHYEQR
jgi:preprotein translocase subunit SecY